MRRTKAVIMECQQIYSQALESMTAIAIEHAAGLLTELRERSPAYGWTLINHYTAATCMVIATTPLESRPKVAEWVIEGAPFDELMLIEVQTLCSDLEGFAGAMRRNYRLDLTQRINERAVEMAAQGTGVPAGP